MSEVTSAGGAARTWAPGGRGARRARWRATAGSPGPWGCCAPSTRASSRAGRRSARAASGRCTRCATSTGRRRWPSSVHRACTSTTGLAGRGAQGAGYPEGTRQPGRAPWRGLGPCATGRASGGGGPGGHGGQDRCGFLRAALASSIWGPPGFRGSRPKDPPARCGPRGLSKIAVRAPGFVSAVGLTQSFAPSTNWPKTLITSVGSIGQGLLCLRSRIPIAPLPRRARLP